MGTDGLVDLHMHSTYSDGSCSPANLVKMAAKKGLCTIAITDHDSVDGVDEAIAAGLIHGIEIIPAVELSVELPGYHDVHLLGYFIDHHDPGFLDKLTLFQARRNDRIVAMVSRINSKLSRERKKNVVQEDVIALAGGAVGRPHIAMAMIAAGLVDTVQEAFDNYLTPCNVPKHYFAMSDALAEIKRIQGVSVLAHPMTVTVNRTKMKGLIQMLACMGLNGIEIINNRCQEEEVSFLNGVALANNLAITGGSDFHGLNEISEMGAGRGSIAATYAMVEELKIKKPKMTALR